MVYDTTPPTLWSKRVNTMRPFGPGTFAWDVPGPVRPSTAVVVTTTVINQRFIASPSRERFVLPSLAWRPGKVERWSVRVSVGLCRGIIRLRRGRGVSWTPRPSPFSPRGGGRESNPPGSFRPHYGFEDRGAHQEP